MLRSAEWEVILECLYNTSCADEVQKFFTATCRLFLKDYNTFSNVNLSAHRMYEVEKTCERVIIKHIFRIHAF